MKKPDWGDESAKLCENWMLNLRFALILLVFIASGFARANLLGKQGIGALGMIFVQYVIFQTVYSVMDVLFFHATETGRSFFVPYLMLWFLVAHIGWRVIMWLMVVMSIKHPVIWATALGVAAGYWWGNGSWLSMTRLFVFLPFFAAGYSIHPSRVLAVFRSRIRPLLGVVSILLLIVVYMLASTDTLDWLYGKYTYADMKVGGVEAALIRAGYYALQFVAGIGFIALIPRKACFWTDLGTRTLYVFLLHGLFVRSWICLDLYDGIRNLSEAVVLIVVIISLTILILQPQVRGLTRWLIEPDLGKLKYKIRFKCELSHSRRNKELIK
jgi:fucose 4-O-acetylase-like acetyltransferase